MFLPILELEEVYAISVPPTEWLQMAEMTRRSTLLLGAGLTLTLMAVDQSVATPAEADVEIAKFTGGKAAESGKIAIDLPEIAENGNTVPLSIKVDSPMTANDYVSEIRVIADGNPNPGVVGFHLTPIAGRAEVATRIRLNSTENVIVLARTSGGKLFMDRRMVKVTVGGCGG
jgi:sulfur-oxidizing protein SoxY